MTVRAGVFLLFCLVHLVHSKVRELSCDEIRQFVDGHNYRRFDLSNGRVRGQPAASEMKFMIWDDELQLKAVEWAARHEFDHNPNQEIGSARFRTGENIFKARSNDPNYKLNIDNALQSWFDEHKDYNYGPLKQSDFGNGKEPIGHYTQMAWSDSIYVGCAVSEEFIGGWKEYIVVCNYGPGGNYIGEVPYKSHGKGSGNLICYDQHCEKPYGSYCAK